MNISENSIAAEMMGNIQGCASDGAALLELELSRQSAAEVIAAVDTFVHQWQKGDRPQVDDEEDLALTLGSLWGEQLVKDLGWQWAAVTFHDHDDSRALGVFSPDRSLAIYPFHFVHGCLEQAAPVTILLAYNLLKDGSRIPPLPAGGYENVMDNVHHIVPRE